MVLINETGIELGDQELRQIRSLVDSANRSGFKLMPPLLLRPGVVRANCVDVSHTGILYLDARIYYPREGITWTANQEIDV